MFGFKIASNFLDRTKRLVGDVADSVGNKKEELKNFLLTSLEKTKNLPRVNYELGLKHLDNGNLWDAVFRFKILCKFWPDYENGREHFAYCLILQRRNEYAKRVLKSLIEDEKDNTYAKSLLESIERNETGAIIESYEAGLNKKDVIINKKE